AEEDGIFLVADEKLQVVTAAGEEVLGVPDMVSAPDALLLARNLARFRRPDSYRGIRTRKHKNDLLDLVGVRDVE
ncbi:cell division protein FtsK, partial [Bacteroides fragilis]|nr:cell division protein FtsK [Bacteroides fragilis]